MSRAFATLVSDSIDNLMLGMNNKKDSWFPLCHNASPELLTADQNIEMLERVAGLEWILRDTHVQSDTTYFTLTSANANLPTLAGSSCASLRLEALKT